MQTGAGSRPQADDAYLRAQARQDVLAILQRIGEGESVTKELKELQDKKQHLEESLQETVSEYFQNLMLCETLLKKSESNLGLVKTHYTQLESALDDYGWAKGGSIDKLVKLKKNTTQVVDTLHDFLNVSSQMKNMKEQMADYRNYDRVHRKLITICSLRDNMMSKASTNKQLEQTFKNFSQKFKEIKNLEEEFFDMMYQNIADCLDLAKRQPKKLVKTLSVIEVADANLKGSKETYFNRALKTLKEMVYSRFENRISGDSSDIAAKLEAAKQSVDDLNDTHEFLSQLFPVKYKIFDFMKNETRGLIESLVLPYLTNLNELEKNPGLILYFISWLDSYELLLKKVGIEGADEYKQLREKINEKLPVYISFQQNNIKSWISGIIKLNREDCSPEALQQRLQNGDALETNYPQEIFRFFNQQVNEIGGMLTGDNLLRILEIWMKTIQEAVKQKADELIVSARTADDWFRYITEVNDLGTMQSLLVDNKAEVKQYVEDAHMERINQMFGNTSRLLTYSAKDLMDSLTEILFTPIEDGLLEKLFIADWQKPEDNIVQQLCAQVQAYLAKLQEFFVKQIDGKIFAKVCATRLVTIYLERFVYYIKMVYGKDEVLKKFVPVVYRPTMTAMKQRTPERERLEKRLELLKCFGRDFSAFEAFITENNQSILPSLAKELLEHWELPLNLIRLEPSDFVDGCKKQRRLPYVKECAEAILAVRRDVSKEAIKLIMIVLADDDGDED